MGQIMVFLPPIFFSKTAVLSKLPGFAKHPLIFTMLLWKKNQNEIKVKFNTNSNHLHLWGFTAAFIISHKRMTSLLGYRIVYGAPTLYTHSPSLPC